MKTVNALSGALLGCVAASVFSAGRVLAQSPTASEASSHGLDEVVVTARKRDEGLQTVPLAVTALTSTQLEGSFAEKLDGIKGMPNVVLDQAPGFRNVASFYIRGIGYQDIDLTFEPGVGVVVDGVFMGKANGALLDVFGLESLEVLRGPQGTLFGKNTIGGVINVRTKRPSGEFDVEAKAKFGNYGRNDYRAAVEAPITDKMAFRVSLLSNNSDGYARNVTLGDRVGGENTFVGRATLVAKPTDSLDITLIADLLRDRSESSPMNNASVNLGEPKPMVNALALLGFPADRDGDLNRVYLDIEGPFNVDGRGVSLETNWKQDAFTVTSISGFRNQDETTNTEVAGTPVPMFQLPRKANFDQFYQELRIATTLWERLELVTGANYLHQHHFQNLGFLLDSNFLAPGAAPPGVLNTTIDTPQRQTVNTYGVFAQTDYKITPDWRVTVGARYNTDKKHYTYTESGFADNNLGLQGLSLGSVVAGAPGLRRSAAFDAKFSKVTWRVGSDYQFTPDFFGYGSIATGFKAGGFNGRATTFVQVGPYDPETVTSYELGLKSQWFENRLRINTAIFLSKYKDLQVEILQSVNGANTTLVQNAASATIKGLEVESSAILGGGWTTHASLGYLDAKYDDFFGDLFSRGFATDNTNLKLRRAPKWTFGAGLNYEKETNLGTFRWSGDWSYTSDYETNVQNYDFGTHRAENLFNTSLGYEIPSQHFGIDLYMRNITNQVRVMSSNPIPPFSSFNQPTDPRVYGVELSTKF